MANYKLFLKPSVRKKDFKKLSKPIARKIDLRIRSLANEPRPPGAESVTNSVYHKLRQGDYRIIYKIDHRQKAVYVTRVGHRSEVYKQK